ncbi:CHAP domain-containing protein [Moraxella nasicaprae]|uniref:CHAP domain-containing protein n=1 Tax=Moraxella nasicaprae TaxID=2904122 RepID=A0ABY6F597_9GAMM|nr:CHAP domain-containing protein [Moraxella nasicaprae]UXZ05264.1 CHAP domain-containing protein [Moraxella nasicaprae]
MKRVFWLMSVAGLTVAQLGASQSAYSNSSDYVATIVDNDIDSTINQLISQNNRATKSSQINHSSNFASANNQFSSNFVSSSGIVAQLTGNSAPSVAANLAARAAHGKSQGRCALYVRRALQAAGYEFTPQPSAYMYANGTLANAGFVKISNNNYVPQVGDVAVFNRSAKNPHGHIQIYDGNQWVSDFRQPKFSPYTQHNGYSVWRDARYLDASANKGTYLAMNDK